MCTQPYRLLVVLSLATTPVAYGQELTVNAAVATDSERIAAATYRSVRLSNVIPAREYAIETVVATHAVPLIDLDAARKRAEQEEQARQKRGTPDTPACEELRKTTKVLNEITTEREVEPAARKTQAALDGLGQTDCGADTAYAKASLARTVRVFTTYLSLSGGSFVTVNVYRSELDGTRTKVAQKVFDTGESGEVRTHVLLGALPNKDERWFAQAAGEGKFTVVPEEDRRMFDPVGAVLFTWYPAQATSGGIGSYIFSFRRGDVSGSWTVGVGLESDSAVYLAGYALNISQSFGLAGGVAGFNRRVLKGIYKGDGTDVLTENLQPDQLTDTTFGFGAWVGITFRK